MKLNKLVLSLLLSASLILGNTAPLLANTNNQTQAQNTNQRVLDVIPSPDATGSISLSDYMKKNNGIIKAVNLNQNFYTIPHLSPVLDQGPFPGCVSFALRSIKSMTSLNSDNPDMDFSNGFIYGERFGYYTGPGMYSIDALQGLREIGDCYYETFPDNGHYEYLHAKITQPMIEEASKNKIKDFIKLNSDDEIKLAMQTISPIYVSFPVFSNYMNPSDPNGIISKPDLGSVYYGDHAGILIGYSYDVVPGKLYFLEQNSWGSGWNSPMNGRCWLPADFPFYEKFAIVENDIVPTLTPNQIKTTFSNQNPTPNESITYSSIATYLYPNQTTSNIVTRDITNYPDLTITTSNPDLISIDKSTNTINTIKTGKASIIFTYKGSGQEFIINISEKPPDPPIPTPNQKIKSLTITQSSNTNKIFTNSSLQFQAIADKNYKTKSDITSNVEWSVSNISNPSLATIDDNGNLNALQEGKVKITAKYTYKYNNKSYTKSDYMYIYIVNTDKYYSVNVLKSKDKTIADNLSDELSDKDLGFDISVIKNGKYYELMVGKFADNSYEIKGLCKKLKGMGYRNSKITFVSGK